MTLAIDAHQLRSHAGHCGTLADKADVAAAAARKTSFHEESYGIIGGLLVYPAVAAFEAAGLAAALEVPTALRATEQALNVAASGFSTLDGGIAEAARKLMKELG